MYLRNFYQTIVNLVLPLLPHLTLRFAHLSPDWLIEVPSGSSKWQFAPSKFPLASFKWRFVSKQCRLAYQALNFYYLNLKLLHLIIRLAFLKIHYCLSKCRQIVLSSPHAYRSFSYRILLRFLPYPSSVSGSNCCSMRAYPLKYVSRILLRYAA